MVKHSSSPTIMTYTISQYKSAQHLSDKPSYMQYEKGRLSDRVKGASRKSIKREERPDTSV